MKLYGKALAAAIALLSAGVAVGAHAEAAPPKPPAAQLAATADKVWTAPAPRRTLQLDTNGRWGLRLDMDEPSSIRRGSQQFNNVQAGAYFRLTPSLRVGGAIGLTDDQRRAMQAQPRPTSPRVHLETAFRF